MSEKRLLFSVVVLLVALTLVFSVTGCQIRAKNTGSISEIENSINDLTKKVETVSEKQQENHNLSSQALSALEKLNNEVRTMISEAHSQMSASTSTTPLNPSSSTYSPTTSVSQGILPQSTIDNLKTQLSKYMVVLVPKYLPSSSQFSISSEGIKTTSPQSYSLVFSNLNITGTKDPRYEANEPTNKEGEKTIKLGIYSARSFVDPDDNRYYVVITYHGDHYKVDAKRSALSKSEIERVARELYMPM